MRHHWLPLDPWTAAIVALVGLCLGSFVNVLIYRIPRGISLWRPASHCPRCGGRIRPWHNIPLAGWILLGGRCAQCREPISPRYPLVELAGGLLAWLAAYAFPTPVQSAAALWFFLALLAVLFIDLEHRIIPDVISIGGTILGLCLSPWTIGWRSAAGGALAGAAALSLVAWTYQRARGRPGMGMGDIKLAAMLGAFLGLRGIVLTILGASFGGSILGISLVITRRGTGATPLPFGSFLAPAAAAVLLWGERVWSWYFRLLHLR